MDRRGFLGLLAAAGLVRLKPDPTYGSDLASGRSRTMYLYYRPGASPPLSSADVVGSWTPLTPAQARAAFDLEPLGEVCG